jgi:hypothetical protein
MTLTVKKENLKRKTHLVDFGIAGRQMLNWVSKTQGRKV